MELDTRTEQPFECKDAVCAHEDKHSHGHGHHGHSHGHDHSHEDNHKRKAVLGIFWGVGLIALSIAGVYLSFTMPFIALCALVGATTLVTLYLGYRIYFEAIKTLFKSKKLTMGALYMISTLTIMIVSIASLFMPWLPAMVEAAPLVLGLFHAGEALEEYYAKKIKSRSKGTDLAVKVVKKIEGEKVIEGFSAEKLAKDDIIVVENGGVIPVDGELILNDEKSQIYLCTARSNGEIETCYANGEEISAGMYSESKRPVKIRVTKKVAESYLAQVEENIAQEALEKAPIENLTDKIFQYFIPALLLIAIVSSAFLWVFFSPMIAVGCFIGVFVSACPCVLTAITPQAVEMGKSKAAEKGIHFKDGKALQAATKVNAVAFDVRGTLSTGKYEVKDFQPIEGESREACLHYMMLLEKDSEHSIGKAIFKYAQEELKKVGEAKEIKVEDLKGCGRKAIINGAEYVIGNKDAFEKSDIKGIDENAVGAIYLVRNAQIIARLKVLDPPRPDAKQTVAALEALGIPTFMITGTDEITAKYYAGLVGIPLDQNRIYFNCAGKEGVLGRLSKTSCLRKIKDNGYDVAMIGDAGNDEVVMASQACSLGIVIESGATTKVTRDNAGVVIEKERPLMSILTVFEAGKKTMRNIYQNLAISLIYNMTVVVLAAGLLVLLLGISLNPVIGVALMLGESLLVFLNMMRFKEREHFGSYEQAGRAPSTHEKLSAVFSGGDPSKQPLLLEAQSDYSSTNLKEEKVVVKSVIKPTPQKPHRPDDEAHAVPCCLVG